MAPGHRAPMIRLQESLQMTTDFHHLHLRVMIAQRLQRTLETKRTPQAPLMDLIRRSQSPWRRRVAKKLRRALKPELKKLGRPMLPRFMSRKQSLLQVPLQLPVLLLRLQEELPERALRRRLAAVQEACRLTVETSNL